MARKPDKTSPDLAAELAKPSFTAGRAHAAALVELVIAGEEPSADRAAAAIATLGEPGRKAVEGRLAGGGDDGITARLVGVLGRLARAGDAVARTALLARVGDPAVRVRRAAIGALGKLDGDDVRALLLARWDASEVPADERRTLAEALGKLGGEAALARLKGIVTEDAELARRRDRAILMADRSAKRDAASEVRNDVAPPSPLAVRLGCRPGLGRLLGEELAALGIAAHADDGGANLRLDRPLEALFAARLWATFAIDLPLEGDGADLAEAIVRVILTPSTRKLLAAWTRGPIRWRLGFASGHRRAIVWRVARDVTAAAPDLINDPSATTWDMLVGERSEATGGGGPAGSAGGAGSRAPRGINDTARRLSLVPRRLADPRFAYRVAEVPAASHPTVAAALAWVAEASGKRVWDPFCGSGLELIECARRGARAVIGSDTDEAALAATRANIEAAGVTAQLALGDARSHPAGPVDAIVTNPPLGSRVQLDAAALLTAALPHLVRQLAPGGRLVWITPAARRTGAVAEGLGLVRVRALSVDLGGVRGQLERWDRR